MTREYRGLFGFFWRFWLAPIRAEPVAAFRILAGIVAFVSLTTSLGPRMALDFGPDGLTPPADLVRQSDDPKYTGSLDAWLERTGKFCVNRGFVGVPLLDVWLPRESLRGWVEWCEAGGNYWLAWLYGVSILFVIAGLFTRLSTLLALLLTVSFQARMSWVLNGGDAVIRESFFYLLLMPAGAVWSVDGWLRRRVWGVKPPGPVLIEPWSVRLAQIQLCSIYLFTGLIKLGGTYAAVGGFCGSVWNGQAVAAAWETCRAALAEEDWLNGVAVYWVLNDVCLNRFPYAWLPLPLVLCQVLSWATLVFEIGFPLLVLSRWTRPVLLAGGAMFHFGIWFHTEVGFFSAAMVAWYPLFLSGAFLAWVVGVKEPPPPSIPPAP